MKHVKTVSFELHFCSSKLSVWTSGFQVNHFPNYSIYVQKYQSVYCHAQIQYTNLKIIKFILSHLLVVKIRNIKLI